MPAAALSGRYLRLLRAAVGGATLGRPAAPPAGTAGAGAFFGFFASLLPFLDMLAPLFLVHIAAADAVRTVHVLPRLRPRPFGATQARRTPASRAKSHTGVHLPDAGGPGIKYVSWAGPQDGAHHRKMQE